MYICYISTLTNAYAYNVLTIENYFYSLRNPTLKKLC